MSNSDHTSVRVPAQGPAHEDETIEGDPMEIQRLLAWYFREDPSRHSGGERDLRDAA